MRRRRRHSVKTTSRRRLRLRDDEGLASVPILLLLWRTTHHGFISFKAVLFMLNSMGSILWGVQVNTAVLFQCGSGILGVCRASVSCCVGCIECYCCFVVCCVWWGCMWCAYVCVVSVVVFACMCVWMNITKLNRMLATWCIRGKTAIGKYALSTFLCESC